MTKIDTSGWKEFVIEDLFEKLQLDIKNESFIKTLYLIFDYPYKYYTFKHFEV